MDAQVILVVEDEVMIRMVLAEMLRDAGYAVVEAANGDEAATVLHAGRPIHLIVTDVRMPGTIDGIALTALSRRLDPARPVIVVSADRGPEAVGVADQFCQKPYLPSMLLIDIEKWIGSPWQNPTHNQTAS
jgi:CheY-like chemotaxis protein